MRGSKQGIIRKMAKKNLASNAGGNIFLALAIFIMTFMTGTVISLCVNQAETQQLYMASAQGTTAYKTDPLLYALAVTVVLLAVAGFLFVFNVMSVFVSRNIRFYGQLRTLGMSRKQIKGMVLGQALLLCAFAIPPGLLLSGLVSLVAVPWFLGMYTQVAAQGYPLSFHPLIFVGTAFLAVSAVLAGSFKPALVAAGVSPIEALRFVEGSVVREKIRTSAFSPMKMAWRNVFRMPGRAVAVFCSLFLGMTLYLMVSVILGSTSVDIFVETAETNMEGDIYLRNGKQEQYGFVTGNGMRVFTDEFLEGLERMQGISGMRVNYVHEIRMDITDGEGETANLPGCVYGVNAGRIARLNKELENPIDEAAFLRGEFVIIRDILKMPAFVGQSVEFSVGGKETPVSFAVGAVLPPEFADYYGTGYNRVPSVYMSAGLLKRFIEEPEIYDIELDVSGNEQGKVLGMVTKLAKDTGDVILRSQIAEEAGNILARLSVMGNIVSAVLWLTGVLNFTCVMVAGILSRRHEFALLESLGQSAGQTKKILMWEGLIYAAVTLLLVGVFGNAVVYVLFKAMEGQFEYMVFTFPFVPVFCMVILIAVICLSIPGVAYRFMVVRSTIVERLREME